MRVTTPMLSMFLRRFPLESGRWRLIPYALQKCRFQIVVPTIRTVRTRHGFRMRVDVSEWFGRHIFVTGEYEPATTNVIRACLKPGGSFIDVGANAGYFSLLAAKCVGPSGQVRSFEPLPDVRASLQENLTLNSVSNCEVFDVALSDRAGEAEFFAGPASHKGISSLRPLDNCSQKMSVRTARLDDLLQADDGIDFVKIDVEGAECHVLDGMASTLNRCKPDLVVEVSPQYLNQMEKSVEEMDALLREAGYHVYAIEYDGLRRLDRLVEYSQPQFNAFATARDSTLQAIKVLEA